MPHHNVNRAAALLSSVFATLLLPALAASGAAIVIPVTNGSFEKPDVLNLTAGSPTDQNALGGAQTAALYTTQTATTGAHYYGPNSLNDPIPYWTVTTANNTGMQYGVINPANANYLGTSGGNSGVYSLTASTDQTFNSLAALSTAYGYQYADGFQTAYVNLASGASATLVYNPADPNTGDPSNTGQSLGNFVNGDNYSLTVAVGTPLNGGAFHYSIELLDNGTPVATSSATSPATASGTFTQATINYAAVDTGAIGIEILASDPNTASSIADFDNVSLVDLGPSGAPPIPEPTALLLLTAVPLLLRRR